MRRAARLLALAALLAAMPACFGPPRSVTEPEDVEIRRGLTYATVEGRELKLDLYRPAGDSRTLPVIVWIYGGGWITGDRSPCIIARYAQRGYAIASIDYRLANEARWPAQIHDCKSAVRWLRANAAGLGIDPTRIAAWGGSAGGHLALMLGTAQDPALEPAGEGDSRVTAALAFFPATDLLMLDVDPDHDGRIGVAMVALLGGLPSLKRELAYGAGPINHLDRSDPPMLLIHGDADDVIPLDQSRRFVKAATSVGAPAEVVYLEGVGHGNGIFAREDVRERSREFIDRVLGGGDGKP